MIKNKIFFCNTELALDIVGGKWKPLIIYHLDNVEVIRFGQLRRLIPNISESVLTRTLRELEAAGIIVRVDFHENPPRVEYHLSDEGRILSPIIVALGNWGKEYNERHGYGEVDFINKYEDEAC